MVPESDLKGNLIESFLFKKLMLLIIIILKFNEIIYYSYFSEEEFLFYSATFCFVVEQESHTISGPLFKCQICNTNTFMVLLMSTAGYESCLLKLDDFIHLFRIIYCLISPKVDQFSQCCHKSDSNHVCVS